VHWPSFFPHSAHAHLSQGHDKSGIPNSDFRPYLTSRYLHRYSLEFHHVSPFGRFRGKFAEAVKFYKHIIAWDASIITTVRDPRQQYIRSCALFMYDCDWVPILSQRHLLPSMPAGYTSF
jgi:hypothetical protein